MSHRANHIVQAVLHTPTSGVVELARDWKPRGEPPLRFSGGLAVESLERVPDHSYGNSSGYFVTRAGRILFFCPRVADTEAPAEIYLAGDFTGWGEAIGQDKWQMHAATLDADPVWLWEGEAEPFLTQSGARFKFVNSVGRWLEVPEDASNAVTDSDGNRNHVLDPERTGRHLFAFRLAEPIDLSQPWRVHWTYRDKDQSVPLRPGAWFHTLHTELPLGACLEEGRTIFRLFAPRASRVELVLAPEAEGERERHPLSRRTEGMDGDRCVWELTLPGDHRGWCYHYHVDGPSNELGHFDFEQTILDPYARASLGRGGPGLIVPESRARVDGFGPPAWQDLVMCEAHVRDLVMQAPIAASEAERRGFTGLRRWVESPSFYLERLGVNCVELQPVQENDSESPEEYHWGYMTTNFFAPHSGYAVDPVRASGIDELRDLVGSLHRRGMAVVLDVVYNHVGVPGHLLFIDKLYYFHLNAAGDLNNWSGCGNDLRADAAMSRRLIIDSCIHLMDTFGVDGFRFDLAELLGAEVLRDIESALKAHRSDVILIAEPWSFRGHIADELATTGWASWNDGYRRFLKDYVRGGSSREALEYFLTGSPDHFAHWPAQTVNYVESHDDRTWIDEITEHADGNGHQPTANDRARTHLMAAVLFSSIGIPMLSVGQDFLRSKHGVTNTYQRGDLNALDYRRLERYSATHAYFADWIRFRRSEAGALLRHFSRAGEGFFCFCYAPDSNAVAVFYNADHSHGPAQLLLALNPTTDELEIPLGETVTTGEWIRVADHERFRDDDRPAALGASLWLPPLGIGLWRR